MEYVRICDTTGLPMPVAGELGGRYNLVIGTDNKWNGKTAFVEPMLTKPLHWKKPRMIFVCSMGDLFHESVPFEWITRVFKIIERCPQHIFQVLTKRPERMQEFIGPSIDHLPNVWLGVTAENQEMADKRIPILLKIPAAKRFVSVEPLLGAIDLRFGDNMEEYEDSDVAWLPCERGGQRHQHFMYDPACQRGLDWVICGAESGPGRRKCEWAWPESIVQQCKEADVPCFVKQIHAIDSLELIKEPVGWPREFPDKE